MNKSIVETAKWLRHRLPHMDEAKAQAWAEDLSHQLARMGLKLGVGALDQ